MKRLIAQAWCLCFAVSLLSATGLAQTSSGPASKPDKDASFLFAAITDTHISDAAQLARFRAFAFTIQDRKVDFLLVLGDVCGHAPEYLPQIRDVIEHSGLKVYTIPGNHDDNYGRNPEWYITAFERSYYTFDHKGWHFVMNDSQIPPPTDWLQKELASDGGKAPTVFCQHYPPAAKQGPDQLPWSLLAKCPAVRLVLTGHEHRRATRQFGQVTYEVLEKCFLTGEKDAGKFYIIQALAGGMTRIRELSLDDLRLREPADKTPVVTISTPVAGQTLRNGSVLRGTALDDHGVRTVECSVDSGRWQRAEGTRDWRFDLHTELVADGHHIMRARGIDSAGQPSIALAEVLVMVENHPPQAGGVFRYQQGLDGYQGCRSMTVRRFEEGKAADGHAGETGDLECWVNRNGQREFNEFYLCFDLAKSGISKGARIKRATLTLYGSRQNQIAPDGKSSRYYVGVVQEPWKTNMTFKTRPGQPAWLCPEQPDPAPALSLAWPYLDGRQMIVPPQPVVIDLTPIQDTVRQWLEDPTCNHGLVFSPAPGKDYNMSSKGSRCPIPTLRPKLEIEIETDQ